jgi:ribosomal protein L3
MPALSSVGISALERKPWFRSGCPPRRFQRRMFNPVQSAARLKMAGHLGAEKVTVQNLTVAKVDAENNLIAIKGAIPGPNGGIVVIRDSVKAAKA